MALQAARTSPEPAVSTSTVGPENKVGSGLIAGEDLLACAPVYIAADGLVYMSGGNGVTTVTSPGADVIGFTPRHAKALQGDPITIMTGVDFGYSTGMTPGTRLYIDTTAVTKGRLNNAQPFAGIQPCAYVIDATRIRVLTALAGPA